MRIMGIDPSFKNLSFSILTEETKTVDIFWYTSELGDSVDFTRAYEVANELTDNAVRELRDEYMEIPEMLIEIPPPNAQYSAGLFSLDTLLIYKCSKFLKVKKIYTVSARFLSHLHGTEKYTKKDSKTLALHFIELMESRGYTFNYYGNNLNTDMSEAFLFMLKALCIEEKYGMKSVIENELPSFYGDMYKEML